MMMADTTSISAVLVGAAVALVWMGWAYLSHRSAPAEAPPARPQRAPKIVQPIDQ